MKISNRGLLGYDVVCCYGKIPTFRWSLLPPSSPWRRCHNLEDNGLHNVTYIERIKGPYNSLLVCKAKVGPHISNLPFDVQHI